MLEDFNNERIAAQGGVSVKVRHGGAGPPLLLLHGYPQTHAMWHWVAPMLADRFTVVCPDLRGYGDSDTPAGGDPAALSCPTLVLWSATGIGSAYDVHRIWRRRAPDLRGRALDCGHFLAEERPDETARELLAFLAGSGR